MRTNYKDVPNKLRVEHMSKRQMIRWICLIQAFDVINEYTENKKITSDNVETSILPIQKYINEIEPKVALSFR